MSVRDSRKAPFHWLSFDEVEHIRWEWQATSPSGATGLGVYRALAELANEQKARAVIGAGSDSYRTSQKEIASRAMVSDKSVAKACEELERIGLLSIECDRDGENRPGRPSFYTLLDPPATYERSSDGEVTRRQNGVLTSSEAISDVSSKGTNSLRTSLYKGRRSKEEQEGARVVATEESVDAWESAKELLRRQLPPAKFDQVRELSAAGEIGGRLILVDRSDRGAVDWGLRAEPVILEALAGYDAVEILDEHELEQAEPMSEFDVWLAHYRQTTGRVAVTGSKEARKLFAARRKDNGQDDPPRSLAELELATIGAHSDEYLRQKGLDHPKTILRESNVDRYIELGRSAAAKSAHGVGDSALSAIVARAA
ncbi:MAG TPA: hypothetical protein VFK14_00300 [Solirubrobacterales bacterium]|nr:hypothetical protein [Solirubrobacterales bacterium]